jgi:Zn-dependent peptidase ImmA (M78 family)
LIVVDREDWEHQVRVLARRHVARFGNGRAPTNLLAIAAGLGVRCQSRPFEDDPDYTGTLLVADGGYALIVVNSLLTPQRRAFTVAHELGHFALLHSFSSYWRERAASVYASELLVPSDRLYSQIRQYGQNQHYLAGLNGVSVSVLRTRMQELPATTVHWIERDGWDSLMMATEV